MKDQQIYWVLAYYHLTSIESPAEEVKAHKDFLKERDFTGRIYLSHEGINGQVCGAKEDAKAYMEWLASLPPFSNVRFKIHHYDEHCFPRMTIKERKQLVALDLEVDLEKRGDHLSPKEWRDMLENEQEKVVVDVRNDYEWEVGRFAQAELPNCSTFREFGAYTNDLEKRVDKKKTPVMMYCTGGIRCELYSALLKEKGFEEVYQLDGGVIDYGLKEGSAHWEGKLFVFDDRLTVPISQEPTPVVGKCRHCHTECEDYYNCAHVECNDLFLCCPSCLDTFRGCCSKECKESPRVRPYRQAGAHKPFQRWYKYVDKKEELYQS